MAKNGRQGKSRHIFRKMIIWLLVLLIAAGVGLYMFGQMRAKYTVTYQPYTATIGSISNALSFNGTLQAIDSATYTANSDGTVRTVYVKAGDEVRDGQKLLRLSNGQTVEAEFDGTVNVLDVKVGDDVKAGDTLCQVVDFVHLKTEIRVDEYDINSVHVGDAIRITTTANEKTFDSTIAKLDHLSSSTGNVANYTATAYVDVDKEVFPGMQITVTLPKEEVQDVVVLKLDAISFDETNRAFVYTRNGDDEESEMEKTYITTGVSNGSYVEIKSGVKEGDTVYAVAKTQTIDPMMAMFSQTQVMTGPGNNRNWNNNGTNRNNGGN
ncbi:MAG: efflux RND transporter periplasmic adaptor subunit, partial [Clostridia bacterium]|nr:efflux RND transporter periplasmic adaptor subunit [Clostridia bacterium]